MEDSLESISSSYTMAATAAQASFISNDLVNLISQFSSLHTPYSTSIYLE